MAITVEPGLYFPTEGCPGVPDWARGIGIRIEDDLLIGPPGSLEVLTSAAPKSPDDVERAVLDTLESERLSIFERVGM